MSGSSDRGAAAAAPTPADHANTVRVWLKKLPTNGVPLAALDALQTQAETADPRKHPFSTGLAYAERAEAAEAERDALRGDVQFQYERRKAAEAAVANAEAERDRLREAYDGALDRLIAAKAERDHARDALRRIANANNMTRARDIARAALGEDT